MAAPGKRPRDPSKQFEFLVVDEFIREVENARIYEGIHYRTSVEVGSAMGKQIGALAAQRYLPSPQ